MCFVLWRKRFPRFSKLISKQCEACSGIRVFLVKHQIILPINFRFLVRILVKKNRGKISLEAIFRVCGIFEHSIAYNVKKLFFQSMRRFNFIN